MKIKWQYAWDAKSNVSTLKNIHAANTVSDISGMIKSGCHTKRLKSKMKRLNTLM